MTQQKQEQRRDPRVREWMEEHPHVIDEIKQRYEELSHLSTTELVVKAEIELGIDVSKVREKLVTEIVLAERKA